MLSELISQLSAAECEAVGVAAAMAYPEMVDTHQRDHLEPVTLSTEEVVDAPPEKASIHHRQFHDAYRDKSWAHLMSKLLPLVRPSVPRREREEIVMAPAHSMVSISRISSGRSTLFDHMGTVMHPIALRLHLARDFDERDRLNTSMMRMEDEQLLEVMLSETQYARLIRCDQSLTPCTLTRDHMTSYLFERNPHFDEQFDTRDIQQEAKALMADEIASCSTLATLLSDGITRKADREQAEATILAILSGLDATSDKLHQLADSAQGQAGDAAKTRHSNLLSREVASLPASMREHIQQLSDAGHPIAKLLTADSRDD